MTNNLKMTEPDDFSVSLRNMMQRHVENGIKNASALREAPGETNRNSALIWLPRLIEAGIPTPRTEFVLYDHRKLEWDKQDCPMVGHLVGKVREACEKIGYPVFFRTDLSSAKHDGPSAYKISSESDIEQVITATVSDNMLKFGLDLAGPKAFLVREWLDLKSEFAAFVGHAISVEWRFFADQGGAKCYHPYWPEESIVFYERMCAEPDNWKQLLVDMHEEPSEIEQLKELATESARLYGCFASVDIALDTNGKWWVTDMATAEESWHWPGCRTNRP